MGIQISNIEFFQRTLIEFQECSFDVLIKFYYFYNMLNCSILKTEPDIGACNDEKDCNNNGKCINNYCECTPGFDDKDYPKDCSSKLD